MIQMAVFITGDLHGNFRRFKREIFYEQAELTKEDYVLNCGDFGGVWDNGPTEQEELDWLEARPFTTLFVSGNHENFDLLDKLSVEEWHGGKIQRVRPSVFHLMRGQIYEIEGRKFFTMGGASSHDISGGILEPDDPKFRQKRKRLEISGALYRVNHRSWWAAELPSDEEYRIARANLEASGWAVDYIITHCCPTSVQNELSGGAYQADHLTDFLDEVAQRCSFKHWFFGHYHDNGTLGKKYVLLYEQIIKLNL